MQLNPLYYVEFRDIYPLRRSAAFKITEFRPSNKVEKEAGTKVGPDQLGPPVRVGSTLIDSDQLESYKKIKMK